METEVALKKELSIAEKAALDINVISQETYARAGELLRMVKDRQAKVKDYWEPMRLAAKEAYDSVLAKKKEMLEPIDNAEKILKEKMRDYMVRVEEEKRKKEAELRKQAEEEAKKKMIEAEAARIVGDEETAAVAQMEAEVIEGTSAALKIDMDKVKADGVSTARTWEIVSINSEEVPDYCMGIEIRPVDTKAVMRLIKMSKGQVKIPGVEYRESVVIKARK